MIRLDGRLDRLDPMLLDVAVALVTGLPSAAVLGPVVGPSSLPLIAAIVVPFVGRRRWPVAAYLTQVAGLVVAAALVPQVAQFVLCFLAVLAGAYSMGRHGRSWRRSLAAVSVSLVPGAIFGFAHGSPVNALWFIQLLFAWAMGFTVRRELNGAQDPAQHVPQAEPGPTAVEVPATSAVSRLSPLTRRELEVLKLLARGHSNGELAELLHIGEGTVKTHVARILAKLGLRGRVQAVVLAYESGLVQPNPGAREPADSENLP